MLTFPVLYLYLMGMGTIQEAMGVLAAAEGSLRHLIEQAMREQRYSDVAKVAGLADGVSRLLQERLLEVGEAEEERESTPRAAVLSAKKRVDGKSRKEEYPHFVREGDKLVKIGWSKKNKSSYEHKAPREAVIAFTRHLTGSVQDGKVFVIENLLPVPDVGNGGELPAYQVYVTLAWLRQAGVIQKKGRDGYVLRRGGLGDGAIDKLWTSLSVRAA